jgi:hypothetical protein
MACRDDQQRRADLLAHPTLNGIDYVEVDAADQRLLRVYFVKPVPPANPANPADPDDAYGIRADLSRVTIAGGVRIVGVQPESVTRQPDGHLDLRVSAAGDFSLYTLTINVPALDPFSNHTRFSFKAACPSDFDCRQEAVCPPQVRVEPRLDYQAKDYASFRRMLLDLAGRLNPNFTERNPADLGIALVELLAYEGDQLSYFQDAVANEAYLETVRQRISARRHARLIDYRMHDGRNAWTWVHLQVSAAASLAMGTKLLTRLLAPLSGTTGPPGLVVEESRITADALEQDPALATADVFETTHPASFDPRNNEICVHTWGNEECCLAPGTREAYLYTLSPGTSTATQPVLSKGDYLLFEEVMGPTTGLAADADPLHRQVVRIDEEPEATEDPVYNSTIVNGALQRWQAGDPALPLLRVRWQREDALSFPLCISARLPGEETLRNVSVVRGNLVLADHGLTTSETLSVDGAVAGDTSFRLALARSPLTLQQQPGTVSCDAVTGRLLTPRTELSGGARSARPAVALLATFPTGVELWTAVPDLLDSSPFSQHFVAEVDNDGRAQLRFGDGEYGREPAGATSFQAVYRVGNGAPGNIGAESIAHLALSGPAGWVTALRNPLAATGGVDPETIKEVRRSAPQAFRAEQFRAVTEADYATAAKKLPSVAGAVASFRWTGSWYTVFVGVDPRDPSDLVRDPKTLPRLSTRLEGEVRALLGRYRLAGYDLEIRPPKYVPLEIDLEVCVASDHFRADVKQAVFEALSNRILPDGTRGFFHPDNFTFGQPVYLSRLYAAVERVEGVDSLVVVTFQRSGQRDQGELIHGVIPVGAWEIALLDNDPNFMENGVLLVTVRGGKG